MLNVGDSGSILNRGDRKWLDKRSTCCLINGLPLGYLKYSHLCHRRRKQGLSKSLPEATQDVTGD